MCKERRKEGRKDNPTCEKICFFSSPYPRYSAVRVKHLTNLYNLVAAERDAVNGVKKFPRLTLGTLVLH